MGVSSQTAPRADRAARWLWIVVAVGLVVYAALTVWLAWSAILFPFQLDYGEGIVLWFAHQLAHGQSIYDPQGVSFATSNYPPVFMLLIAPFDALFGASYVWGRWLNFAATLVCAALVTGFVKSETRRLGAGLIAGLFFFGSTYVYNWVPLLRVDMTGLAFTLGGVWCIRRWERAVDAVGANGAAAPRARRGIPQPLWLGAALVLFLLAVYTKHSLLFAPAATVVALFLRDKRAALAFALALGLVGGGIFLWADWVTRGGWSFGLIGSNATVWSLGILTPLLQNFAVTYDVLLILALWEWIARVFHAVATRSQSRLGILEVYFAAALLSVLLAGREGAWVNYLLEAVAMVCVFAGLTIARTSEMRLWRWVIPLLLILQLGLFWRQHDPAIAQNLFAETRVGNADVGPLVRDAHGAVISEDMGLLVTNSKPVVYYSFPYSTLARAGKWDQHWELENLNARAFPLVILMQGTRADVDRFGNFTRAFVSALDANYGILTEDVRYQVYAPSPIQHDTPLARFGGIVELAGWSLTPSELAPREKLTLTTLWHALAKPTSRWTGFAHIEAADGGVVAQDDHEPLHATYPTTGWANDEKVRDTFQLQLPAELKPGRYVLRVGWYDTLTQDRVNLADGNDSVILQEWTVP